MIKRLFGIKRKLQSSKNAPESLRISYAISNGVKQAVERAIHDTDAKTLK